MINGTILRRSCFALFMMPAVALAEPVQIDGPQGPLEAEQISVEGAAHAVVIIPGSGPTDRDGNSPQTGLATDSYKLLAEGLAELGIASLRIDKRGFFGSANAIENPNAVTIEAYAEDARRWLDVALDLAPCVWLAGHSEGGLVALVAAQTAPDSLCGLILLATPGRPIGELMVAQFEANPANGPLMPELRAIVADLEAGKTRDPDTLTHVIRPLFSEGLQRYMIDLFSYDPKAIAQDWPGRALIVHGDQDIQVGPEDAAILHDAMPQATRLDLVDGTHMLKRSVPGDPFATYTSSALPLHDALVPGIRRLLEQQSTGD